MSCARPRCPQAQPHRSSSFPHLPCCLSSSFSEQYGVQRNRGQLKAVYVVANYKETQLTNVRAGQPVTIGIDGLPETLIKGRVDSVSPASGLEFALLPPDNATGNFTKIVQRVPVKIVLDDRSLSGLLRPGMSAEPTVNTKATVIAEREAARRLAS